MRTIGTYRKVEFDSVEELKDFVENLHGDAYFYSDFTGEEYPIQYIEEDNKVIIGSDGWEDVRKEHLDTIYGYIKID